MYSSCLRESRAEAYSKPNLIIPAIVLLTDLCRRWLLVATVTQLSYPAGGGRIFSETSTQANFIPSWHISRVPSRRTTKFCAAASDICESSVLNCHPSGSYNFEVAPRFLEDLWISVLYCETIGNITLIV